MEPPSKIALRVTEPMLEPAQKHGSNHSSCFVLLQFTVASTKQTTHQLACNRHHGVSTVLKKVYDDLPPPTRMTFRLPTNHH